MGFSLIPKDESFFDLFERMATILQQGAGELVEAMTHADQLEAHAQRLERLEHDGDLLIHEVMAKLNRTFITPLDREDLHRLGTDLDDVLDLMEAVTERSVLYRIRQSLPQAMEMAKVIQEQVNEIHLVIPKLRQLKHDQVLQHCIEINRLENVGDRLLREALSALFAQPSDPLNVIKWRELYDLLETATDKCEDVAVTIESIVLKNA